MVAAGLSGPARAVAGSVRDHVLGATLLNGRGEVLSFGGQVMKNVAGYDVSRVLAGSLGILGLICEVSLKVLPVPTASATLRFECDQASALKQLNAWGGEPLPLSASACWNDTLVVRLRARARPSMPRAGNSAAKPSRRRRPPRSGAACATRTTSSSSVRRRRSMPARRCGDWLSHRPRRRSPCPASNSSNGVARNAGCAQRAPAAAVREVAAAAGGHATLYRGRDKSAGAFHPLSAPLARLHRELKRAFDPDRVFNRGRLYAEL